jgi:Domain of unknown function (DUF4470)
MLSPHNSAPEQLFDVFPKATAKSLTQYLSQTGATPVNCLLLGAGDPGDILYTIMHEDPSISRNTQLTVDADRRLDITCCDSEAAILGNS